MKQKVGVFPPRERRLRSRLFDALELAFPVEFLASSERPDGSMSAAVFFSDSVSAEPLEAGVPVLRVPTGSGVEKTVAAGIEFAEDVRLDPAIRGRRLTESTLHYVAGLADTSDAIVLAESNGTALWIARDSARGTTWASASPIPDLGADGSLRGHLREGHFAGLLPLVQFLKHICAMDGWVEPPLRSSIIIDDPNLHSVRYGYIRFPELARHADEYDYHVAMAMVPLDGWYADPRAKRIFKDSEDRLSLLIHGNNHVHHELNFQHSQTDAIMCIAQALRRIEQFEQRTGLKVSRIIAPPHGVCSEIAVRAMMTLGIDALCVSRPYPWLEQPPGDMPLAGWFPAEFVTGGFPIIPRYHLNAPRDDLVFRAFLRQPLVLYGHHDDVSNGLAKFSEAAEWVRSLGDIRWCDLGEIARSNYATMRVDDCLHVRRYSNDLELVLPDDVSTLELASPPVHGADDELVISLNGIRADHAETGMRFEVASGNVSITLRTSELVAARSVPKPPWRPWPVLRRLLTEGRDRLRPLVGTS